MLNDLPRLRSSCENDVPRNTFRSPVSPGLGGLTEALNKLRSEKTFAGCDPPRVGDVWIAVVRTSKDLFSQLVAQPARSTRLVNGVPEFQRKIPPNCHPPIKAFPIRPALFRNRRPLPNG